MLLERLRAVIEWIRLGDESSARLALAELLQEESGAECYIPAILKKAENVGMSLADELAIGGSSSSCSSQTTEEVDRMFWQASFSTALDGRCNPVGRQ